MCSVWLRPDGSSQGWASPHYLTIHVNCLAKTKLKIKMELSLQ